MLTAIAPDWSRRKARERTADLADRIARSRHRSDYLSFVGGYGPVDDDLTFLAISAQAEWAAAHDREEDTAYYHRRYTLRGDGCDSQYAADFARQLNHRFGDREVDFFAVEGTLRQEWRPADAEPGTGLLSRMGRDWLGHPPIRSRARPAG